jgi:hypothetical protein
VSAYRDNFMVQARVAQEWWKKLLAELAAPPEPVLAEARAVYTRHVELFFTKAASRHSKHCRDPECTAGRGTLIVWSEV